MLVGEGRLFEVYRCKCVVGFRSSRLNRELMMVIIGWGRWGFGLALVVGIEAEMIK